jgi:alpha-galactosidase
VRSPLRLALVTAVTVAAIPLVTLAVIPTAQALNNGVGQTPPMGWNDWNTFGCNISDALIRQTADVMVSSGMAAAGYQYVNIDDCWEASARDAAGNLVANATKFPNGIKPVADYVHSKGLKIGIYSEAGTTTCAGYPGSLGHEAADARTFASWGIDYLKYDNCGDHGGLTNQQRYTTMRDALAASGRTIFYNLCEWGQDAVWTWGAATGNSWRTTSDIQANWGSVMNILDQQVGLEAYSSPGGWNDPDMLEVGNSGLTDTESRAHFSLWSLLNAPLIAGNDVRSMSAATLSILTNTEVIAVNQNWGGKQGYKLRDDGDSEVWLKPMANGSKAVVLLNRGASTATISVTASALGLGAASSYGVRDLWAHTTGTSAGTVSASVPSHGATMLIVSGGAAPTTASTSRPPTSAPPSSTRPPTSAPPTSAPPTSTVPTTRPPTSAPAPTGRACAATYRSVNSWPGGFQAEVAVANSGTVPITGWRVTWTFPGGQTITQFWNAAVTASGAAITATNLTYNGSLGAGASTAFGFNGTWTGTNTAPTSVTCTAT